MPRKNVTLANISQANFVQKSKFLRSYCKSYCLSNTKKQSESVPRCAAFFVEIFPHFIALQDSIGSLCFCIQILLINIVTVTINETVDRKGCWMTRGRSSTKYKRLSNVEKYVIFSKWVVLMRMKWNCNSFKENQRELNNTKKIMKPRRMSYHCNSIEWMF